MKSLHDFAKEKANFIALKSGESYSGIYRGYKFIEKELRGETKEYARYMIEDLEDGKVRNLDSQASGLALQMEKIVEGSLIKISRKGEGFETKFKVEALEGVKNEFKSMPSDVKIPVIEEEESKEFEE